MYIRGTADGLTVVDGDRDTSPLSLFDDWAGRGRGAYLHGDVGGLGWRPDDGGEATAERFANRWADGQPVEIDATPRSESLRRLATDSEPRRGRHLTTNS